jgi:hypothetical protein
MRLSTSTLLGNQRRLSSAWKTSTSNQSVPTIDVNPSKIMKHFLIRGSWLVCWCAHHLVTKHNFAGDLNQYLCRQVLQADERRRWFPRSVLSRIQPTLNWNRNPNEDNSITIIKTRKVSRARPSNDLRPKASCAPSCGKDTYLSSLSNCAGVVAVLSTAWCMVAFAE